MEPSKTNATSTPKVPDLNRRDAHRQTIPVAGDGDDLHDSPPPYEPSSTVSTSASANGTTTAAVLTPPASTFQPSPASPGRWEDDARSSTSSLGDEDAGFLAGRRQPDEGGYRRADPMVVGRGDDRWESMMDQPGCCCSESGGCCGSSRGGCCFSDRGGCCFSDRGGCCFSDTGGCCFSDTGGCCFSSDNAACFSSGVKSQRQ